jgi:hypothetical protein
MRSLSYFQRVAGLGSNAGRVLTPPTLLFRPVPYGTDPVRSEIRAAEAPRPLTTLAAPTVTPTTVTALDREPVGRARSAHVRQQNLVTGSAHQTDSPALRDSAASRSEVGVRPQPDSRMKPVTTMKPTIVEREERSRVPREGAAQHPIAQTRSTGDPPSTTKEEHPPPPVPSLGTGYSTGASPELSVPPIQKIEQRSLKLPPRAAESPERPGGRATVRKEPRPGVHIGSLEVRIVAPPQPAVPLEKLVQASAASARSETGLARGFGSFGLTQS